jgi:hypothetical protein
MNDDALSCVGVLQLYDGSDGRNTSIVESYTAGLHSLDESIRRGSDVSMVKEVLDPIDAKLSNIKVLKESIRERDLVKTDYDARYRRVRQLKEKGSGSDPHKLLHEEEKLERTKVSLENLTVNIFQYVSLAASLFLL